MSNDIVISVENLSKLYRLGQIGVTTLRESTERLWHRLRGRSPDREMGTAGIEQNPHTPIPTHSDTSSRSDELWALKDVSFSVQRGEVLGIIGRNGAGKSTLLKILSRITEPTSGRAVMRGRVGSLLEVGTGFHPELTGRENIYLNGAILGMKRAEIAAKFDEIVAFAEIEKFIDTPVKRYSSGMYVRLAFAVAAHLDPEILLVDEVLAVGDVGFQRKCLGKMGEVARGGRTVLFVSHNMAAVRQLCGQSAWVDAGQIGYLGDTGTAVDEYVRSCGFQTMQGETVYPENPSKEFQLLRARILDDNGQTTSRLDCDEPVVIDLQCRVRQSVPGLYGYLQITRTDGTPVMVSDSLDNEPNPLDGLSAGTHTVRITIPRRTLAAGDYSVYVNFTSLLANSGFNVDSPGIVAGFRLQDTVSRRGNNRPGFFSTLLAWDLR